MDTLSIRITALVIPTVLIMALLLSPIHAHAGDGATDCHEIPKFVLERIEIVTGMD
jgi:hypothetical protein